LPILIINVAEALPGPCILAQCIPSQAQVLAVKKTSCVGQKRVKHEAWQTGSMGILGKKSPKIRKSTRSQKNHVDGRLSYQSSYGFASGQIHRRSQGTLLPSNGEPKVSNPWNNVQHKDSI
jgi:hypothetical protein